MSAVNADIIQFAFTVMFHYLFPITTMGLAPFVAWYTWRAARTKQRDDARAASFWTKIFTIAFAIGVISGIPMEFQFGTNWAAFAAKAGAVVGQTLSIEAVFAFFLESIFLGALFYARGEIPGRLHVVAATFVWIGSWISAYFIITTEAWMQHPVGYAVDAAGRYQMSNLWLVVSSPFAWWQFAHVICGALLAGSFVVAGVGAYYLLAQREKPIARSFVTAGVTVGFLFSMMAIFPTGDVNGKSVTQYQPVKLAAMEGLFETTHGAPLAIIGMPNTATGTLIDPIYVPDILSFLAYGNFTANVSGLKAYPKTLWPPVDLTYYAYHVMVGLGTIFAAIAALAALLLWRRKLFAAPLMLWLLMLAMPFPYIANEAGWVTAEVGRQPWVIYGLMRTSAGASPNVVTGETIFTLIGFAGMYFILGLLFIYLVLREIGIGPGGSASETPIEAAP